MKYTKYRHIPLEIDEQKITQEEIDEFALEMVEAGKRITEMRKANGYSEKELAILLEVAEEDLRKLERGELFATKILARRLAKLFHVDFRLFI